jgi:hypothetical protein
MDVRRLDLQRPKEKLGGHAVITVGMVRWDTPFVRPEEMCLSDSIVLPRLSRDVPEKIIGDSTARQCNRERLLHLRNLPAPHVGHGVGERLRGFEPRNAKAGVRHAIGCGFRQL